MSCDMDRRIHFHGARDDARDDGDDAKHCNASTNSHSYANKAYSNRNAGDNTNSYMDNHNMMAMAAKRHRIHDTSQSHMLHILV